MATLTLEDGTGVSGANTYATLGYISGYCSDMGFTSWSSVSTNNQIAAVLRAMDYIESFPFKGVKVLYNQDLKWPRSGMYDEDGYALDNDTIPEGLKKALSKAAYEESQSFGVLQPNITSADYIVEKTIDVITFKYSQDKGKNMLGKPKVFYAVEEYLKPYIKDPSTDGAKVYRT
jgi:hypothetical protein